MTDNKSIKRKPMLEKILLVLLVLLWVILLTNIPNYILAGASLSLMTIPIVIIGKEFLTVKSGVGILNNELSKTI